jgi:hypothetical protein
LQRKELLLLLLFDTNSDVAKKIIFVTFSFRGDTQKPLQKKPSRRRRKKEEKDVGIVRSHPRLVHGRTPPPPVLVSMRVRRQKARVLSSFS